MTKILDRLPVVRQVRQSVGLQRGMLVTGLAITAVFVLTAIFAPLLAPFGYSQLRDASGTFGAQLPPGAPPDLVLPAILISVLDEGNGLQHKDAESVFVPFFRSDDVKKRKIEGVGLGLAVTRSLVEIHRGKIWAVPVPPATGGCFLFTLPTVRS